MRFHAGAGSTRSNSMRGRISPKVMAMMIRNAWRPLRDDARQQSPPARSPDRDQFDKARRGVEQDKIRHQ